MALIFWGAVIGFLVGYVASELVRGIVRGERLRNPRPKRTARTRFVPCPYCRKPSAIGTGPEGPQIECADCGIFGGDPGELSDEAAELMDLD